MRTRPEGIDQVSLTPDRGNLQIRRESLMQRLEDGYARIEQAALAGDDVTEWEAFWMRLLREYEDVCRDMDIAA